MRSKSRQGLTLAKKRAMFGYVFTLPFIIGFIFVFFSALVLYITLSFKNTYPSAAGLVMESVGLKNYSDVLFIEEGFLDNVFSNLGNILVLGPAILLYSFFIANILNRKFHGMTVARCLFFLPVVAMSGFASMQSDDLLASSVALFSGALQQGDSFNLTQELLSLLGTSLNEQMFGILESVIEQVYTIVMGAGVQIIVFLAGLQTISTSLYEVADIEGASSWEKFWKITLPMISPIIIVNAVYTLVDLTAGSTNSVMAAITDMGASNLGKSAAMGLIYFSIIFIVMGILIGIINKFVFYENK